jgi:hypothetical protein
MMEHQAMHGREHESGSGHADTAQTGSNLHVRGGYWEEVQNLVGSSIWSAGNTNKN